MDARELRQKRLKIIADARAIADKARDEKRNMTAEETANFDKAMSESDELRGQIERIEKLERDEAETRERVTDPIRGEPGAAEKRGGKPDEEQRADAAQKSAERRAAFRSFLRGGEMVLTEAERRALSVDVSSQGGALVPPLELVRDLLKFIDDDLFIRGPGMATIRQVPMAQSLGVPSLETDPSDADWTAEVGTVQEDSSMAFGARELHPRALTKLIKVSDRLLRLDPAAEQLVISRLAYKFAVSMEKAYLTGNGANQPLGLFVASTQGISTSRDVSTGNTATAVTMTGLINAQHSVKAQYRRRGSWLFHRDGVKQIRTLRSDSGAGAGTGDYLWQPSQQAGQPDTLLGRPIMESEYVPNTFTTGLYVGLFGDFSFYWIADALQMQVQRLNELYAGTRQRGFIGTLETDGMPALEEAFVRVKLA